MSSADAQCGWHGDLRTFRRVPVDDIIFALEKFVRERNPAQLRSWRSSIALAQEQAHLAAEGHQRADAFWAVLEYEIPRQGGRRPDIIILENGPVLVIEYKDRDTLLDADIDQLQGYVQDLKNFHPFCHEARLIPILVVHEAPGRNHPSGVRVIPMAGLAEVLLEAARTGDEGVIDGPRWIAAEYTPRLDLVEAARVLFREEKLPAVNQAASSAIDAVVDFLVDLSRRALEERSRHLVLLTGVPGSGKTLAGLRFAYDRRLGRKEAVFLSGNGPLVQVLQYALGPTSKAFVQPIKPIIAKYARGGFPRERIVIFDEAQRAWDREKVRSKHPDLGEHSEPELLVRALSRSTEGCVLVALMGMGQEIFTGEEAGIGQWRQAVDDGWTVHGHEQYRRDFRANYAADERLELTLSIRSPRVPNTSLWSGLLLNGKPDPQLAVELVAQGFPIRVTRDFDQARRYVRERFEGEPHKRCGLLVSSKARNHHGPLGRQKLYRIAEWFHAPPRSPWSCCRLELPATEFECQGLELDFTIVCWGDDFVRKDGRWEDNKRIRYRERALDPFKLRQNTYRVLLSRSREGMILYVPPEEGLDETFRFLVEAGAQPL